MNRHIEESYVEFAKRVTNMLECDKIGYKEWGDALLGIENNYSSENLRKAYYVISKMLPKMDGSAEFTEQDIIDNIQSQKDELYKEKCRLQDQRREYNKLLRAEARFEHLRDVFKESLDNFKFDIYEPIGAKSNDLASNSAVLCLSDWHYGALVDSQWNLYNTEIAEQRAREIFSKAAQKCIDMRVRDLVIEINGDMVEGIINISNKCQSEETVVEQIVHVSELLGHCINSIKPYVKTLKVVTTLGNHGRLCANKKEQTGEKENFEMIIPTMLRYILDKDIELITSQGMDIVMYEFNGMNIGLAHGHNDKPSSAIENFVELYKVVPDEIHLGHYHSTRDINESNIYINVNGSLKGADDYAVSRVRATTKPSQNMIVYGDDRMVIELSCK